MRYNPSKTFSAESGMADLPPVQRDLVTSQIGSVLLMLGGMLESTPTLAKSSASNAGPLLVKLGRKLAHLNLHDA